MSTMTFPDVDVRVATRHDAAAAATLLDSVFSDRTEAQVVSLLDAGDLCLLGEVGGRLVAVATARMVNDGVAGLPVGQQQLAERFGWTGRGGVVASLVVTPEWRRSGLCTALVGEQLVWMREQGARYAFSEAWVYPDGRVPARGPLTANGFRVAATVPEFWRAEAVARGYDCDECVGRFCCCAAMLFTREVVS